jgi:uncharacterized membrane protein (UPF0127 family)
VSIRRLGAAFLLALVTCVLLGPPTAHSGSAATARLTLDGVPFQPELALTSGARARGLMNRHPAPADGMLFVFGQPSSGGFWMKNTLVPLTIVFFNADGERVRRLSMTPCRDDPCRIYSPGKLYRFALELRAGDPRAAWRLGPIAELRRLVRRAS